MLNLYSDDSISVIKRNKNLNEATIIMKSFSNFANDSSTLMRKFNTGKLMNNQNNS